MAFGIFPKYNQDFILGSLNEAQFLALAIETAQKLDWKIEFKNSKGFTAFTNLSLSSWNEKITVEIQSDRANLKSECTGNQITDWGKNKKNIDNFINKFLEVRNDLTELELEQKVEELNSSIALEAEEENNVFTPKNTTLKGVFSIFKPTKGYFTTPILIDINILLFIIMTISGVSLLLPDNESLLKWGANFKAVTLEGEWWRLITSCFLHIGIFHLLMNMYALLYIGILLEPYLDRTRFFIAYLMTGIAASLASLWWNDLTISAGASGAIFGMYGVFLAMLTTNIIPKFERKALKTSIVVFVGYNIFNGLSAKSGIDNAAHIGGLLSGLAIGYALIPSLKKANDTKLKFISIGLITIIVIVSAIFVYKKVPNDLGIYDKKIKEFSTYEAKALEVYKLPQNTPTEVLLLNINEKGIHYWNQNLKILNSLDSLKLPFQIRNKNRKLKQYCELRLKSFELLYKAVSENTNQYQGEIDNYYKQIEAKLNEIN